MPAAATKGIILLSSLVSSSIAGPHHIAVPAPAAAISALVRAGIGIVHHFHGFHTIDCIGHIPGYGGIRIHRKIHLQVRRRSLVAVALGFTVQPYLKRDCPCPAGLQCLQENILFQTAGSPLQTHSVIHRGTGAAQCGTSEQIRSTACGIRIGQHILVCAPACVGSLGILQGTHDLIGHIIVCRLTACIGHLDADDNLIPGLHGAHRRIQIRRSVTVQLIFRSEFHAARHSGNFRISRARHGEEHRGGTHQCRYFLSHHLSLLNSGLSNRFRLW